jgi:F-type H+-transporting ATPase subunit epsilon/F-type H+-transporting ATPase subunit delta
MDRGKIDQLIKQAESDSNNSEINDQDKYLIDQKIETLKTIN